MLRVWRNGRVWAREEAREAGTPGNIRVLYVEGKS
jgi:hypothetical protein